MGRLSRPCSFCGTPQETSAPPRLALAERRRVGPLSGVTAVGTF